MLDELILKELSTLMKCFPNRPFINWNMELILDTKDNVYFRIVDLEDFMSVKVKALGYVSRYCCKGTSVKRQDYFMDCMNRYLNIDFTKKDWQDIYQLFGNGCEAKLCRKFVETGHTRENLRYMIGSKYER